MKYNLQKNHYIVHLKLIQYCKSTIPQLKKRLQNYFAFRNSKYTILKTQIM